MTKPDPPYTLDQFLGGRFTLRQPAKGFRAGQDGVLLAACLADDFAGKVLDLGAGSGVVSLCAAARCPHAEVLGVEIDAEMSRLAAENAARNGMADRVEFVAADVTRLQGSAYRGFDAVLLNPPYFDAARHRPPQDDARALAMMGGAELLVQWLEAGKQALSSGGMLAIIHRPDLLAVTLSTLTQGMGAVRILPVLSRAERAAEYVIVTALKARKTPLTLLPALVTDPDGDHGALMRAVLRDGAALPAPFI